MNRQMEMMSKSRGGFASHGWLGLGLIAIFWTINWTAEGPRSHWAFAPLWVGYCLTVDALVYLRKGSSLLTRSWRKYAGLFLISAPVWWLFEIINLRLNNWHYHGGELFTPLQFSAWATLSFTTVIPAVFGSAELIGSFDFIKKLGRGPVIRPNRPNTRVFFISGLVLFTVMLIWPQYFFPFVWLSLYFILEPINIWLGNRNLGRWTEKGDWRPVVTLWLGVLMTAFFWEMWNYFSYPKWIYHLPWGQFWHVFEMPFLGYGGYLPFSLELYAVYHLVNGFVGERDSDYVRI